MTPALDKLAGLGERTGHGFPDPEPAVRPLPPHGRRRGWRIGVAIGDQVLDLQRAGLIDGDRHERADGLPGAERRRACGGAISQGLRSGSATAAPLREALVPQAEVALGLPCEIGDYTDFYTSIHHATTVGKQFRPDNPLLPNYKWVPIGYHGRASSIGASARDRACSGARMGQTKRADARRAQRRTEPAARLRARTRRVHRRGRTQLGEPIPIVDGRGARVRPRPVQRLDARATSRPGSTSRSGRSSRRISPARSRPGW